VLGRRCTFVTEEELSSLQRKQRKDGLRTQEVVACRSMIELLFHDQRKERAVSHRDTEDSRSIASEMLNLVLQT
jgi:hypothetical protein